MTASLRGGFSIMETELGNVLRRDGPRKGASFNNRGNKPITKGADLMNRTKENYDWVAYV